MSNRKTTKRGDPLRFLIESIKNPGEACIEWPYGDDGRGYGGVWFEGKKWRAHRLSLTLYQGLKTPPDGLEVAHAVECHNPSCINPRHLRFATASENHADKLLNGTHRQGEKINLAKLTEVDVLAIMADTRTHQVIAKAYGVADSQISRIKNRQTWRHITAATVVGGRRRGTARSDSKLTEADVIAIRADTRTQKAIGADYGISDTQVGRIKRREKWAHVK